MNIIVRTYQFKRVVFQVFKWLRMRIANLFSLQKNLVLFEHDGSFYLLSNLTDQELHYETLLASWLYLARRALPGSICPRASCRSASSGVTPRWGLQEFSKLQPPLLRIVYSWSKIEILAVMTANYSNATMLKTKRDILSGGYFPVMENAFILHTCVHAHSIYY